MEQKVTIINLNGKTIRNKENNNPEAVTTTFLVEDNEKVIFNGHGFVDGGEGNKGNKTIGIAAGGEVEINGGVFTVGYDKDLDTNSVIYLQGNGAKLVVNDGVFKSIYNDRYTKRPWSYVINVSNGLNNFDITINGGEFYGWDPAEGDDKLGIQFNGGTSEGRSWIAEGYESYIIREDQDVAGFTVNVYGIRKKTEE